MAKEPKRHGMLCKNEHDTLLAIKVSLLTQVSGESKFSHNVFWIFDNLPNMHHHEFKPKKCEKCKGKDCEAFKKLKEIKKLVADPSTVNQGIDKLTEIYRIPAQPE
ncbi:MAG: hypothetical protein HQL98_09170 [Magnetococcales bacterium]|nr:hypothetical protein [Magnetococcales bacterium]